MFSACSGLVRSADRISILHISSGDEDPLIARTVNDLGQISDSVSGSSPYWQTRFEYRYWQPSLNISAGQDGQIRAVRLLTEALYGQETDSSIPVDTASVQWRMTSLIHAGASEWSDLTAALRTRLREPGEQIRIMIAADLSDPEGSGIAFAAASCLRKAFSGEDRISVGFSFLNNIAGTDDPLLRLRIRENLLNVSESRMIRDSAGNPAAGADSVWVFGLPAGCRTPDPEGSPVNIAFARACAEFFTSDEPVRGFRTVSIPGVLTWDAAGRSADTFAAFVRMSVWLLTDLLPSIETFCGRSSVRAALSPSPRAVFFRRFFQATVQEEGSGFTERTAALRRVLKQILTHVCAFVRYLPDALRLSGRAMSDWSALVSLCGQCVTLGSAWDVAVRSAEEAGLDKIKPVHRSSLADTEEEKAQRDLKEKENRLDLLLKKRQEAMNTAGGFRSAQALADCLARCEKALAAAVSQLKGLRDSDVEKVILAESRVATLQAAVDRTRDELRQAVSFPAAAVLPSPGISASCPWAGELFDQDGVRVLFDWLTADGDPAEDLTKQLRDRLQTLIPVRNESDPRLLMKEFISACRDPEGDPFAALLEASAGVFLNFTSLAGTAACELPPVMLMHDTDLTSEPDSVRTLQEHTVAPETADPTAARRGLLAMLLLIQYRRGSSDSIRIVRHTLRPADGPDIAAWLDTVSSASAEILCLQKAADEFPVALILPGINLFTVPLSVRQASLIPGFVLWFSPLTRTFSDPCVYLNESDRTLITEQLTRLRSLLDPAKSPVLNEFLGSFHRAVMHSFKKKSAADPFFMTRLTAVCGLCGLPAYSELVRHEVIYEKAITDDTVCSCLSGADHVSGPVSKVSSEINYSWKGIPFARESSSSLLETVGFPDEADALNVLKADSELLFDASDLYRDALQQNIPRLLKKYPVCSEDIRSQALAEVNRAAVPIADHITELNTPVDPDAAASVSILREAVAPLSPDFCLDPFSSRLAVIPRQGHRILGDSVLSEQCVLKSPSGDDPSREIPDDAVIPPFSTAFASALCETESGRTLMSPDLLDFRREGESIRVSILLHAAFDVRLTRIYQPEEIIYLYSDDIPTVAIWPAIPFAKNDWKAYYSFGHMPGGFTLSAILNGRVLPLPHSGDRYANETAVCPACFILKRDGCSVGALPNILPGPALPSGGTVAACIDYGSSGISVVLNTEDGPEPLSGEVTVRTLLRHPVHSRQVLRDEFLPAVPVTPILPSATRLFRNVPNQSPVPFTDGSILMPSSLDDLRDLDPATLFTSLKWTSEKSRSSELCLHQVMLMAALQARLGGASSLCWRLAVPDEMAFDGKQMLAQHFSALAETVSDESGLLPPSDLPLVAFASESTANGSYFRTCAPDQTGSGFMVLDIGSCSSDLSLFLRGHTDAVRACRIPMGIQYMMIPSLLADPQMLSKDFGSVEDESFRKDLQLLADLFTSAQKDKTVLRKARLALDTFVADRLDLIRQFCLSLQGGCSSTASGSMMLVHHAWLMTLSGLLLYQMASDPTRNDALPARMNLFMSGRGVGLMESMSEMTRAKLARFLTLCGSSRVHGVGILWSTEKKMEIPVGLALQSTPSGTLPRPAVSPVAIPVKPVELISRFLLLFLQEFPNSALTIFPGWYSNDPYRPLSAKALDIIDSAVSACFSGKEVPRPFDSLAACLTFLLESAGH